MRTKIEHIESAREIEVTTLSKINAYLQARKMAPTRFGRLAVRDPRLVHDLRNGREPGPRMVARIEAFLSESDAR